MANYTNHPGSEAEYRRRRAAARRRRKKQILRNRIIFAVICLALLALLIFGITKAVGLVRGLLGGGAGSSATSGAGSQSAAQSTPQSAAGTDAGSLAASTSPLPQADPSDWRMILVNNNVALPDGYEVETKVAESNTGKELQTEAAEAYIRMRDAASAEGVALLLCSGYRSVEYQTGLFNDELAKWKGQGYSEQDAYDKAKTVVAVPGYSEHNTGLAADIVTPEHQNLDEDFEETDAFAWLSQHAAEYGFILRYPLDKQAITGIIYEPWHYRYVGPENAAAIRQSGLCLEEYLAGAQQPAGS